MELRSGRVGRRPRSRRRRRHLIQILQQVIHDLEKEAVADTKPPVRAKGAKPTLRAVRAKKGTKTKHSRAA